MILKDYLDTTFPVYKDEWKKEDIISHFMTEFGVDVKFELHTEGHGLFLFKYGMLEAKWQFPITHVCRGIILRDSKDGWEIMSYPFNKFFNQHEGHCPIFKPDDFAKNIPNLSFVEKADGTCIQLWYDTYQSKWRVSTLGSITTTQIHDSGTTFDVLFEQTIGSMDGLIFPWNTYIFELCTTLNRVVTRYPKDCVYLIGIRFANGELADETIIHKMYDNVFSTGKFLWPKRTPLSSLGINSLEEAQVWVEAQTKDRSMGEYPEGFVVYDDKGPVCKMKNSAYLALHHSLSDAACTRNAVIASFFKGTMDDLFQALPEPFQKFADKLKDWLADFKNYLNTEVATPFHHEPFETRKEYALYVQSLPERERMFRGFFFSNQEGVCDKNQNLGDLFTKWICENYEKYEDFFKNMKD